MAYIATLTAELEQLVTPLDAPLLRHLLAMTAAEAAREAES